MKTYLYLIFLILFSSLVSSEPLSVEFSKEIYFPGETVQVDIILDNVDSFNKEMISLSLDNSEILILPYLSKLNFSHYYLYFDISSLSDHGNYTLKFSDVSYIENNYQYEGDFSFDFKIEETNNSVISFNPGVIISDNLQFNNLFEVYVFNEGNTSIGLSLNSTASFIDVSTSFLSVLPGFSESFTIYMSDILFDNGETEYVHLFSDSTSYFIPIFITDYADYDSGEVGLIFVENLDYFNINISSNESREGGYVKFKNFFNVPVNNVNFYVDTSLSTILELSNTQLSSILPGEVIKLEFDINKNKNAEQGIYEGYIWLSSENSPGPIIEDSYPIVVTVYSSPYADFNLSENNQNPDDYFVQGMPQTEQDIQEDKEGVSIWIWGIIFIIGLVIILYLRYKHSKANSSVFFFL